MSRLRNSGDPECVIRAARSDQPGGLLRNWGGRFPTDAVSYWRSFLISWRGFPMITGMDCEFAQVEIGETFLHLGISYRKTSKNSATLFDADAHEAIYRFCPDDAVTLVDEPSPRDRVSMTLQR